MSDTDTSTIKGKSYSYDPVTDTVTFLQESGRRVNQDGEERWVFNGGDILFTPNTYLLNNLQQLITAATIVGKNNEIAGFFVIPKIAVKLFLLGVITKEHLLAHTQESEGYIDISRVEICDRTLLVRVTKARTWGLYEDEEDFALLDSHGQFLLMPDNAIKKGGFSYRGGLVSFYGYKACISGIGTQGVWSWDVNWFEPGAFTEVPPNKELLTRIEGYIENKDRQAQGYHSWKLGMLRVSPRCAVELFLLGVIKLEHMTRAVEDKKTYQDGGKKYKYMDIPEVEICGHQFTIQVMATKDRYFCYVFVDVSDGHIFEDSGAYMEYTKPSLPL